MSLQWTTLKKRADWDRLYEWDFSWAAEVAAGETLVSPSVPAVSGLTIGTPVVAGTSVTVRISGGTAGGGTLQTGGSTLYALTCVVSTSGGRTLSMRGYIRVES